MGRRGLRRMGWILRLLIKGYKSLKRDNLWRGKKVSLNSKVHMLRILVREIKINSILMILIILFSWWTRKFNSRKISKGTLIMRWRIIISQRKVNNFLEISDLKHPSIRSVMTFHLKTLRSWIKIHQALFQIPNQVPTMNISKIMGWGCKNLSKENTKIININLFHDLKTKTE